MVQMPVVSWSVEAQHLAAWAVTLSREELEVFADEAIPDQSPGLGCTATVGRAGVDQAAQPAW